MLLGWCKEKTRMVHDPCGRVVGGCNKNTLVGAWPPGSEAIELKGKARNEKMRKQQNEGLPCCGTVIHNATPSQSHTNKVTGELRIGTQARAQLALHKGFLQIITPRQCLLFFRLWPQRTPDSPLRSSFIAPFYSTLFALEIINLNFHFVHWHHGSKINQEKKA